MKKMLGFMSVSFLILGLPLYVVGGWLIKAHHIKVSAPVDFDVQDIYITKKVDQPASSHDSPKHQVAAWFKQGEPDKAGILLLHGVRSNRQQMIQRMRFLHQAGYSVMAVDMQAHGETKGKHITFGYLESQDVDVALAELKRKVNGHPVGIIGVSLGGAATLLSSTKTQADAIVLESVYPTIEQAIDNRLALRLGSIGRYLSPLLTMQLKPRLGIGVDDLKPIDQLPKLTQPVFIIGGDKDRHTTLGETNAMYTAANEPKQLWIVKGGAHVDFSSYQPDLYRKRILMFFQETLDVNSR